MPPYTIQIYEVNSLDWYYACGIANPFESYTRVDRSTRSLPLLRSKSEEVGFEPTDPAKGLLFSRQAQSATLPLFQIKTVAKTVNHSP